MESLDVLRILSESLLNVCLLFTGLVVLLAIIGIMSKGNIIRKIATMLGRLMLFIWYIQISCSLSYLFIGIE